MIYKGTDDKPFELYGATPSPQYPSEIKVLESGSTEIKKICKNIMPIRFLDEYWQYTDKGIKNVSRNNGTSITRINLKKGQTVKVGLKLFSKPTASASFTGYIEGKENTNIQFNSIQNFNLNQTYTRTYTATEDCSLTYTLWGNANSDTFEFQMWAELDTLTDYEQYKEEVYNLNIQKDMLKNDYFDLENNKETHNWGYINTKNITNLTVALNYSSGDFRRYSVNLRINNRKSGEYLKIICTHFRNIDSRWNQREGICGWESGQNFCIGTFNPELDTAEKMKNFLLNNDVELYYELAEQEKLDLTDAQIEVLEKLNKLRFYKGVNNIFTTEDIALLQAKYPVNLQTKLNNINTQLLELGGN